MMPSTLGYWNIRGVVRLMLRDVGEEYEEKMYNVEGPPPNKNDWFDKKFDLGLEMANLPYYMDSVVKMSQSGAIIKYLGKKYGPEATTDEDVRRHDQALFQGCDMQSSLGSLAYNPNFEALKGQYLQMRLPMALNTLEHFIGDRDFVRGKNINYADFRVYESLAQHLVLSPECLKDFPKLAAYVTRFEKLPAIKAYLESKYFYKEPIFSILATWSSHPRK